MYNLPQKYPSAGKNGCSTQLASSIFVTRMRTTKVVSLAFLQNLLRLTNVPKRFTTTKASTQKGNEDALRQEIYGINQEVWKLICCLMPSHFLNTKTKMVLGVKKFDFYIFVYKRSWVYLSAFKCTFLTAINTIEYLWVQVCSVESNRVKLT